MSFHGKGRGGRQGAGRGVFLLLPFRRGVTFNTDFWKRCRGDLAASFSHVRARTGSLSPQHFPVAFPLWRRWKSGDFPVPCAGCARSAGSALGPAGRSGAGSTPKALGQIPDGHILLSKEGGKRHNFLSPLSRLSCPPKYDGQVGARCKTSFRMTKPLVPTPALCIYPCRPGKWRVSAAIDRHSRQVITLKLERSVKTELIGV